MFSSQDVYYYCLLLLIIFFFTSVTTNLFQNTILPLCAARFSSLDWSRIAIMGEKFAYFSHDRWQVLQNGFSSPWKDTWREFNHFKTCWSIVGNSWTFNRLSLTSIRFFKNVKMAPRITSGYLSPKNHCGNQTQKWFSMVWFYSLFFNLCITLFSRTSCKK